MKPAGIVACAALALAGSIGLALSSASASVRPTPPDVIAEKGKLVSDGVLTVNQPETVRVKALPPKTKLTLSVSPPPATGCGTPKTEICITAPIPPAPGATRFRTNGKGRATLTFITPDHYDLLNAINLTDRRPVPFANGQPVVARASGVHPERRHGRKELIFAFAQSGAVVETARPVPAP